MSSLKTTSFCFLLLCRRTVVTRGMCHTEKSNPANGGSCHTIFCSKSNNIRMAFSQNNQHEVGPLYFLKRKTSPIEDTDKASDSYLQQALNKQQLAKGGHNLIKMLAEQTQTRRMGRWGICCSPVFFSGGVPD